MTDASANTRRKWRPSLSLVVFFVLTSVLTLPLFSLYFLKVYQNQLIQQTEAELIAQSAALSAVFHREVETGIPESVALGTRVSPAAPKPSDEPYQPIWPALELASESVPQNWTDFAEGLLQSSQLMAYVDGQAGTYRYAAFENHVLVGAVFFSRAPVAVVRNWLAEQLGKVHSQSEAMRILAGRSGSAIDCGSIVCACNNVGKNSILSAISRGAHTVNAVGDVTKAGTSCGSCRAEIQGMLHGRHLQAAE